jgi:hypothetical protein
MRIGLAASVTLAYALSVVAPQRDADMSAVIERADTEPLQRQWSKVIWRC